MPQSASAVPAVMASALPPQKGRKRQPAKRLVHVVLPVRGAVRPWGLSAGCPRRESSLGILLVGRLRLFACVCKKKKLRWPGRSAKAARTGPTAKGQTARVVRRIRPRHLARCRAAVQFQGRSGRAGRGAAGRSARRTCPACTSRRALACGPSDERDGGHRSCAGGWGGGGGGGGGAIWAPLKAALPDLERRDLILVGGCYLGRSYIAAMGHYCGHRLRGDGWKSRADGPRTPDVCRLWRGLADRRGGRVVAPTCLWVRGWTCNCAMRESGRFGCRVPSLVRGP